MSYKGWDPDLKCIIYYLWKIENLQQLQNLPFFIYTLKLKIYKTCNFNCKAKLYHKRSKEQNDLFIA